MTRLVYSKNEHHKTMCSGGIGLRAHILDTILGLSQLQIEALN